MPTINMRSTANTVKGQGVGSCYDEQVKLVSEGLPDDFKVLINSNKVCDITHYHTVNPLYYIERLIRGRKSVNVGYVHFLPETVDDSIKLNKLFRTVFYKYLIHFYNSMDYLVTVNPCIIDKIRKYDLNRPKLLCIPNFVSEDNFFPIDKNKILGLRKKFNLPEDKFISLGVGQLQTRKGIFDFIETAKKTPEAYFVWAGGFSFGKMTDGYDEIKLLLKTPPKNVNFIGMIERSDMNELYNACDAMFLPSFDELFPMAILEAVACRKPIILRDIVVYENILFNHYIKASDSSGFSDAIKDIMEDQSEYDNWAERSWECHKRYDEKTALELWTRFYTDIHNRTYSADTLLRERAL